LPAVAVKSRRLSADKSRMERRAGPRYEAGQSAQARLLDGGSDVFPVRIENVSGAGMRLLLDRPLALGALIKVEWDDVLLLGEVRYCEPAGTGYAAGLELEHALLHTGELARLSRRLLCEDEPVPAPEQEF